LTTKDNAVRISQIIQEHEAEIGSQWISQLEAMIVRGTSSSREQLRAHCQQFLAAFANATRRRTREHRTPFLGRSARPAGRNFVKPRQKRFDPERNRQLRVLAQAAAVRAADAAVSRPTSRPTLADASWALSSLLDKFGLFTIEVFQKARDQIIVRQQQELLELSTPVVKLWDGILALPLIGTLDSARTQVVMENILQKIVDTGAVIAIIDITGVPMVDTLVAQHLMKTIAAARLMGADCIISGIRPQIAQTIVHLGVNLEDVVTKATLADAFLVALERTGASVTVARKN
jgi:rsbT co-antagonist protein RsbR